MQFKITTVMIFCQDGSGTNRGNLGVSSRQDSYKSNFFVLEMPQLDRRIEVSEAAWKVIVREGLDRTSIRAIARELDCTTGVVTHYFRDKQELILFALNQVTAKLQQVMEKIAEQPFPSRHRT